jgi:hypothetical protein
LQKLDISINKKYTFGGIDKPLRERFMVKKIALTTVLISSSCLAGPDNEPPGGFSKVDYESCQRDNNDSKYRDLDRCDKKPDGPEKDRCEIQAHENYQKNRNACERTHHSNNFFGRSSKRKSDHIPAGDRRA